MVHRVDGAVTYADEIDGGHTPVTVGTSSTAEAATGGTAPYVVRFLGDAKFYVRKGATGVGAATTSFYAIPANLPAYIGFKDGETHFRMIADAAGTTVNWSIVA